MKIPEIEKKSNSFTNRAMSASLKDIQNLTKIDQNTGKYTMADKVGRNVSIGLMIILIGIVYSIYGLGMVISVIEYGFGLLLLLSVVIYLAIKVKLV